MNCFNYFELTYGHEFVYSNEKLYHFNGVFWDTDNKKQSFINNFIDTILLSNLLSQCSKNEIQFHESEKKKLDKAEQEEKIKEMKKNRTNVMTLRNYKSRGGLIEEIITKITNDKLEFNENRDLFAFNNKIFNTKLNSFVEPHPEQYISYTSGFDYDENYDEKYNDELDKIIDSIFPNKENKDFYLSVLATGLIAENIQKFIVATGVGGNGKGLLNDLAMKMFGNYGYLLPNGVLLAPIKVGNSPEVANMHNKRFVIFREPDANRRINAGTLKEITGGSFLNSRLNNSNDCTVKLKLTLVCECNELVKFDKVDQAIVRRLYTVPFASTFMPKDQYDEIEGTIEEKTKQNIFIINEYYSSNDFKNKYKQALFNLIVKRLDTYNKEGLKPPNDVKLENSKYLEGSDCLFSFINEHYEIDEKLNKQESVKIKDVYESFTHSIFYTTLSKKDIRKWTKVYFEDQIQSNVFLKKYLTTNKDKTKILNKYKRKVLDSYEPEEVVKNDLDV